MNVWIIPALVFAVGCLSVAIWALIERGYYKAQNEAMHEEHGGCIIARDSFKLDLEACQDEHKKLSQRVVDLLVENGALNLKLKEAQKPRTRVSRAKPPLAE